jgi:hypothetical protein
LKPLQEQVGEQERREMVKGEGVLDSVRCCVAGVPLPAGVVDQDVDAGEGEQLVGEPPHLGEDRSATKAPTFPPPADRIASAVSSVR